MQRYWWVVGLVDLALGRSPSNLLTFTLQLFNK